MKNPFLCIVSVCVFVIVLFVMICKHDQSESAIMANKTDSVKAMTRVTCWGDWEHLYGYLQQDKDIARGTLDEIKSILKEKEAETGNCRLGHTEAFESEELLLVYSWYGNPCGNVYDLQVRVYRKDQELMCRYGEKEDLLALSTPDLNLIKSNWEYVKTDDRWFLGVNSCRAYVEEDEVWIIVGDCVGEGRSKFKLCNR